MTAAAHERLVRKRLVLSTGDSLDVLPLHLSVTHEYPNGNSHNVHVMHDGDLSVKLGRGGMREPKDAEDGILVLALGVDEDYDVVSIQTGVGRCDMLEMVRRGQEALALAEEALRRVQDGPR